jgi:hypothetical protein
MGYNLDLIVYDITDYNYYLHGFGIGAYHTTLHIMGIEYSYGFMDSK